MTTNIRPKMWDRKLEWPTAGHLSHLAAIALLIFSKPPFFWNHPIVIVEAISQFWLLRFYSQTRSNHPRKGVISANRGTHGNNGSTCLCLVGQSFFAMVTLKDMDGLYRFATLHYMVSWRFPMCFFQPYSYLWWFSNLTCINLGRGPTTNHAVHLDS